MLFNVLSKDHNLNIWNRVMPAFVLIRGKIANKNGNENMYLPATKRTMAEIIKIYKKLFLKIFLIFSDEVFAKKVIKK